ncbi:MAG: conjugal transfer protein TraI [Puia sp.]|nr:conjugal transfer protein TraI [Puia sp.]
MKTIRFGLLVLLVAVLVPKTGSAQIIDAIEEVIKEAIMEIDLGIQKVQTETVYLQDAQKELENTMHQLHLTDITSWVQKQKDLYSEYYQELWQIKTAIAEYQRVKDIIAKQIQLVKNYKTAYALMGQDKHFSANELSHIYKVYDGILAQSIENVNQISMVINAFITQMDDADRLRIINNASDRVDKNYSDLGIFTQQNIMLSVQRSKDQEDMNAVMSLYGLQ